MVIAGFVVHYFISWHETIEDAFDVFILCATNDQYIDGYTTKTTKEGSLYAERTLDVISSSAMTSVRGIIESASKTIRKLHVWKFFVREVASPSTAAGIEALIQSNLTDRAAKRRTQRASCVMVKCIRFHVPIFPMHCN
jgi:hypothetical protein